MGRLRKILVLYVGGTIGMQLNDKGALIPVPNIFLRYIKDHPELHDINQERIFSRPLKENELILPLSNALYTIIYEIVEYTPLQDSSNMSCKEWIRIAEDIENNYSKYDGFVILHGTDTMAYTSSILSFVLNGHKKPVIITGSQIPIFESRSDAKCNLLSSIQIAGCYDIPEVCIFFGNKLFRGNRTAKISSDELNAFDSPNYPPLAEIGIDVKINHHYIRKPVNIPFEVHRNLNPNVAILVLFPTITCEMLECYLKPPTQGLVLESYGSGNLPSSRIDLLHVLKEAIHRKILIVNVTQCARGVVSSFYECGKILEEIGVISGRDMTAEAALTKLSYILGLPGLKHNQRIELMKTDIRGELTSSNEEIPI